MSGGGGGGFGAEGGPLAYMQGKDCYCLDFCGTFRAESPTYAPRHPGLIETVRHPVGMLQGSADHVGRRGPAEKAAAAAQDRGGAAATLSLVPAEHRNVAKGYLSRVRQRAEQGDAGGGGARGGGGGGGGGGGWRARPPHTVRAPPPALSAPALAPAPLP
eukprot:SAG31_NODE_5016_length_2799_cov_58.320000_3_plen_159_part_01